MKYEAINSRTGRRIEKKLSAAANAEHLSKSEWITRLLKAELASEWPESIAQLAGAWKALPLAEEGRANPGKDAKREAH